MLLLSLTTWSLHRCLGPLHWTVWDEQNGAIAADIEAQPELLTLLELPAALAERKFAAVEIGHFHIRDTSDHYLSALRQAVSESGVVLYSLLLDYGDISSADERRRRADIDWIKGWIDIARKLGAQRVRVVAGESDPGDRQALERSMTALSELIDYAAGTGVRIVTENFRPLASTADNCVALLAGCGAGLGLVSDFGNYKGPRKYDELSRTVPHSETVHAKALTDGAGHPDGEEFARCMSIVRESGFSGAVTIVYDGPGDMWEGIERVRRLAGIG